MDLPVFLDRWRAAQAAERANYQLFLTELCDLLGVPHPAPATGDPAADAFVFERPVRFGDSAAATTGFIDLYKRGCFVLETKQGADARTPRRSAGHGVRGSKAWERALGAARQQAARYARNLGPAEPVPPFLVVADVGYVFDLYADFSGLGRLYTPFPDAGRARFLLPDLARDEVRERLRLVFTDPHALDPARHQARVTRHLAERLARLAASFERDGHPADAVFGFLSRCLFSMFAEDVGLLPERAFTRLLDAYRADHLALLPDALSDLWQKMDGGGFAPDLKARVRRFNGHLFHDTTALPLSADQVALLLEAARQDWQHVEPAIFGTLLERALAPEERRHLGAHYTPRAYVERLVIPTVLEPLRAEWEAVQAAVAVVEQEAEHDEARFAGQPRRQESLRQSARHRAAAALRAFQHRLAHVRVLDPACGSGNFLYVTLDHLKRLEAEVTSALARYGEAALELEKVAVTPAQLLGLEVNPRAAAIADLVLWIGYLQGQITQQGGVQALRDPVLEAYGNIRTQDAVVGDDGTPAPWPEADFIVGNPPFIGASRLREALGDAGARALWHAYDGRVPQSADYVAFWWDRAAQAVRDGHAQRFGFITTNSLSQTFNRRVVERHVLADDAPLALVYAVPDHPWVDGAGGAAVRIAMTVGARDADPEQGRLATVVREEAGGDEEAWRVELHETRGRIHADLTTGVDVTRAGALKANAGISSPGLKLHGAGFIVPEDETAALGLGRVPGLERHLRPYRNGRDLTQTPRGVYVIDLFGLDEDEARERFPAVYEHVLKHVKPERDKNRRATYRDNWWIHGEPRRELRPALDGLPRYIATVETAKHRVFQFLDAGIAPDNMLVVIASDDAHHLGVLSSRVHVAWALAQGGRLGYGNDPRYNKSRCFETFPFPDAGAARVGEIRRLAEALDVHRKARQEAHPSLTLTDLYNAVEALRAGRPLTGKEQRAADHGFAATLVELHRRLDAAVLAAYGWPEGASEAELLERLVALNAARQAEEAAGVVRHLRPAFQAPGTRPAQGGLPLAAAPAAAAAAVAGVAWPEALPAQMQALRAAVAGRGTAGTAAEVAAAFTGVSAREVAPLLDALAELGLLHADPQGRYGA